MVERVESQVSFVSRPSTDIGLPELGASAVASAEKVMEITIRQRQIEWGHAGGTGGYVGLSERLEEKVTLLVPHCDPEACEMRLRILADEGDTDTARIRLLCPQISRDTREAAEADEAKCETNHMATRTFLEGYFIETAQSIVEAVVRIRQAQAELDTANQRLNDLV